MSLLHCFLFSVGESEESSEVTYQNEDEEAANNIAMANQVPTESFNFVGNEHFGEGEGDDNWHTVDDSSKFYFETLAV